MVLTTVICDCCHEKIEADRTLFLTKTGPERLKRPSIDLCVDCLARVVALIDARPAGCTAPTPRANHAVRVAAN